MERTYERSYQRPRTRKRAGSRPRYRQDAADTGMRFEKKLAFQAVACAILFALIWGGSSISSAFSGWIRNEITYAVNHQTDFETAYRSAAQITKYFASLLVKPEAQEQTQPADGEGAMPAVDGQGETNISVTAGPSEAPDTAVDAPSQE